MADVMDEALERVKAWPADRRAEAAEVLLALDEIGSDPLDVDDATPAAVDEALAQIERGETADPREVEAFFARYRP